MLKQIGFVRPTPLNPFRGPVVTTVRPTPFNPYVGPVVTSSSVRATPFNPFVGEYLQWFDCRLAQLETLRDWWQ